MKERPTDWSVDNGAFIGYILVGIPQLIPGGMARNVDGWLAYCCDLRAVNEMKRRGTEGDEMEQTSLYHNGTLIGIVNAPIEKLQPHWISVRHVFDEPAFYDPSHPSQL